MGADAPRAELGGGVSVEPGIPDLIVEYGRDFFRRGDGQLVLGNSFIVSEQTWGELVSGYRCAWCLHAQSQAWPERCEFRGSHAGKEWGCADQPFPQGRIRDEQMRFLHAELERRGDFTPPDPADMLDDERDYWKPHPLGIVVPRNASLS